MLPRKTLVVYDFDNTLIDTYTAWAEGMDHFVRHYQSEFGVCESELHKAIHQLNGQHRFGDFGGMTHSLKNHFNIPAQPFHDLRRAVREACFDKQKDSTQFYDGTIETLDTMQRQGTAQVIYTNSEFPPFLRRLWLASCNAVAKGKLDKPEQILTYFSGIFARPSYDCDSHLLWDIPSDFIQSAKAKSFVLLNKKAKPYPDNLMQILKAFDARSADAIVIGDNEKDSGCAYQVMPEPVDFCWYEKGALLDKTVVSILNRFASPDYLYEFELVKKRVMDFPLSAPCILKETLEETFSHFSFEASVSRYPRRDVLAEQNILPVDSSNRFLMPRSPQLEARYGIATHVNPEMLSSVPAFPVHKAGPERQVSPA